MQASFLHASVEQVHLLSNWAGDLFEKSDVLHLPFSVPFQGEFPAVFFVPEPLILEHHYYYVTDLWQKYFAHYHPEVKVIGFGYQSVKESNYLDLFSLPENAESYLSKSMNAEKNIIFRKGKGENIRNRTQKFFEGHGDQSVTDELDKVLRIMQMADDEMSIHQEPYQFIQRELFMPNDLSAKWQLIKNRWSFYAPFFKCTPFYQEMETLWTLLQKISPFFDGNCEEESLFWDLDCVTLLKKLKTGLSEIEKIYVG